MKSWCPLLLSLCLIFVLASAEAKPKYLFEGNWGLRFGVHAMEDQRPSTEQIDIELSQKANFNREVSGVIGGRAFHEGVYRNESQRYSEDVARQDSFGSRLMDTYLQYKSKKFMIRAGQQSVVWSETFGLPSADIVNPKDFRDGGLGSMSSMRLPIPMLNTQVFTESLSLQGIYIPQPYFNILPLPGSDFSLPYGSIINAPEIQINRETTLPATPGNAEYGARIGGLFGTFDLGLFYFDAFDRNPHYAVNPESNPFQKMVFDERHSRIITTGATASFELQSIVYRLEFLKKSNLKRSTIISNNLVTVTTDELVGILGMDFPTWRQINFGFRLSESLLQTEAQYMDRDRRQTILSVHLHRQFLADHMMQMIYAYEVSDGGQRVSVNYTIPASTSVETTFGVDGLFGPSTSEYGRLNKASRVYISLRHFFGR